MSAFAVAAMSSRCAVACATTRLATAHSCLAAAMCPIAAAAPLMRPSAITGNNPGQPTSAVNAAVVPTIVAPAPMRASRASRKR
jgi:hypothetical protein